MSDNNEEQKDKSTGVGFGTVHDGVRCPKCNSPASTNFRAGYPYDYCWECGWQEQEKQSTTLDCYGRCIPLDDTMVSGTNVEVSAWCPVCGKKSVSQTRPTRFECCRCGFII